VLQLICTEYVPKIEQVILRSAWISISLVWKVGWGVWGGWLAWKSLVRASLPLRNDKGFLPNISAYVFSVSCFCLLDQFYSPNLPLLKMLCKI
jgi:hypothetical protein